MTALTSAPESGPISWDVAEQVVKRLLRSSPLIDRSTAKRLDEDFSEATSHGEALVEQVTGLRSQSGPARSRATDRTGWATANVGSFSRLLAPLNSPAMDSGDGAPQSASAPARAFAGAEVGFALSWMSKRVLGQYDLLPYDAESGGDIIYFVGPNVVTLERRHGFPPREFRLWITLHELTHRAQFTGVPWMHEYFLGIVEKGLRLASPDASTASDIVSRLFDDVRQGRNPIAQGGLATVFASSEQMAMLREAQAFMSLLEGHGNYVMTRAGADEIPGAQRFSRVLAERRTSTRGLAKIVQQLLGMEAKLRQYGEGERFVEAVVEAGGDELLARVWIGPENLPTLEEIHEPQGWIERVGGSPTAIA